MYKFLTLRQTAQSLTCIFKHPLGLAAKQPINQPCPPIFASLSPHDASFLLLLTGCLLTALLSAQSVAGLRLDVSPDEESAALTPLLHKWSPAPEKVAGGWFFPAPDTLGGADMGLRLIRFLQENTYLGASLDDYQRLDTRNTRARLFLGPPMRWVALRPAPGEAEAWLDAAGFPRTTVPRPSPALRRVPASSKKSARTGRKQRLSVCSPAT